MQEHLLWETDEAPAVRRRRLWEQATRGASITLGTAPPPAPIEVLPPEPSPPPLTTIPAASFDNCQDIINEVLTYHGLAIRHLKRRSPRARACLKEMAFRLLRHGRRNGQPLTLADVGALLNRQPQSVRYSVLEYERRLREFEGEDAA
jgi:hypothetical protein